MPGPVWDADDPADTARILTNIADIVLAFGVDAPARQIPTLGVVAKWHEAVCRGCSLPVPRYAGHFRGDMTVPELVGYEVGVGPIRADGFPTRMGVWSYEVRPAVIALLSQMRRALHVLDSQIPAGRPPSSAVELQAVANLSGVVHGEWVRIHPYANGNGRTARLWAAWMAKRYSLPIFVRVKPRPGDTDYAIASHLSMGRPPDFQGDHQAARLVFAELLAKTIP